MSLDAQVAFVPMTASVLDWVVACEAELHPLPWTRGNFSDALESGNEGWLLTLDGRPLGYAIVQSVLDEAHLLTIGVAASAQDRGLGRALLAHLVATARARGANLFFLEVRPSNAAALALYHDAGFEVIGRRRGYYPAAGGRAREDAVVMRLSL